MTLLIFSWLILGRFGHRRPSHAHAQHEYYLWGNGDLNLILEQFYIKLDGQFSTCSCCILVTIESEVSAAKASCAVARLS